eukprot:5293523-Amphidinium_carterae.1
MSKGKAIGVDGVQIDALRELPVRVHAVLAACFNLWEHLGSFPEQVQQQNVIWLAKPGCERGPPTPSTVRPIVLLSHIHKLW